MSKKKFKFNKTIVIVSVIFAVMFGGSLLVKAAGLFDWSVGVVFDIGDNVLSLVEKTPFGGVVFEDEVFKADVDIEGELAVTGATTFTGAIALSSTLAVAGATTLTGPLVHGGSVWSTTSAVASTFTAANICDNSLIQYSPLRGGSGITVTLPATTTLYADCLTVNGMTWTTRFENSSSTVDTEAYFTITRAAGLRLYGDDADADLVTSTDVVTVEFNRVSASTTNVLISPYVIAQ